MNTGVEVENSKAFVLLYTEQVEQKERQGKHELCLDQVSLSQHPGLYSGDIRQISELSFETSQENPSSRIRTLDVSY